MVPVHAVKYKTEYDEDDEDAFYHWYKNNESVFQELFQYITDEVFYCLFANHPFLVRFNNIVAALIKNENEERDFDFPKESIEKNGTIKQPNGEDKKYELVIAYNTPMGKTCGFSQGSW